LRRRGKEALEEILAAAESYLPFLLTLVAERSPGRIGSERALRQALGSIAEVADPIRREYLLQEAADLFGIRQQTLQAHLDQVAARSRRTRSVAAGASETDGDNDEGDEDRAGTSTAAARSRPQLRSFARVDVAAIEMQMFAHILKDASGTAARVFLDERGDLNLSCREAARLGEELESWRQEAEREPSLTPAAFVQRTWHEPADDRYRNYVSDLLVKEEVPDRTDFSKAIRESLERLRQGQRQGSR
jgi:DNA primase